MDNSSGVFRTFFIFHDLPYHLELRVDDCPLMGENLISDFDFTVRNPKDLNRKYVISGTYSLYKRTIKFGGKYPGFTQYLEWHRQ